MILRIFTVSECFFGWNAPACKQLPGKFFPQLTLEIRAYGFFIGGEALRRDFQLTTFCTLSGNIIY